MLTLPLCEEHKNRRLCTKSRLKGEKSKRNWLKSNKNDTTANALEQNTQPAVFISKLWRIFK